MVCVNTLTADGKYPLQYGRNLHLRIRIRLSEKRKASSQCFVPFVESILNFKHLLKEDDGHS